MKLREQGHMSHLTPGRVPDSINCPGCRLAFGMGK